MKLLAIETSCDETAICLIEGSGEFGPDFKFNILGNALSSQAALHAQYGGVFPNLAKREHAKALVPLLSQILRANGSTKFDQAALGELLQREPELLKELIPFLETHAKPDIDAIAVTHGPGLEPALWVGVNFAKALSAVWNIPIVAVNHMEGHIVLSMSEKNNLAEFEFPVLALLISGGHTELVLSKQFGEYELVGQTRDDAAGEAFDKVARLLDLPYPGGPEISRLATEARNKNIMSETKLPRPMLHEDNFDFSFSGLKTAVRRVTEAGPFDKVALAREFEDAVADVLVGKTLRAVDQFGANTVVVGGGVSANTYIRERLAQALTDEGNIAKLLIPPPELATDNAIMIALAGYFRALKKEFSAPENLIAAGNLSLETISSTRRP
jgi:N6-L-threonylcarbamoyladenine synthase